MQIRAAARTVQLHGRASQTPLIIPSFSSRAKPPTAVGDFLHQTLHAIGGPILVSAYDVAHQCPEIEIDILAEIAGASLSFVLLDSGGYEVQWNERATAAGLIKAGSAPDWSLDQYRGVLAGWPVDLPLLAVSWDGPNTSIEHQIQAASDLAREFPNKAVELLLKPPTGGFEFGEISALAKSIGQFPVVGVTEVEIGASMADRLQNISKLRQIFDLVELTVPIHIFGGLDPGMTPLYHAAGADIFDGLSWLRYAYQDDIGVYDKSFVAIHSPRETEEDQIWGMRARNVRELVDLQVRMTQFQHSQNFSTFGPLGEILHGTWKEAWQD